MNGRGKVYPCTCINLLPMYPDHTGPQSNNAMQPTEDSTDVIVSLNGFQVGCAAADGGR